MQRYEAVHTFTINLDAHYSNLVHQLDSGMVISVWGYQLTLSARRPIRSGRGADFCLGILRSVLVPYDEHGR